MTPDERIAQIAARAEQWEEEWKPLPWTEDYQVSSFGNVRSRLRKGNHRAKRADSWRLLATTRRRDGRITVAVPTPAGNYATRQVSHLVMAAFVGPRPEKTEVAHLNGNCSDNRVVNLVYCTHAENESHKRGHGTSPEGERNPQAVLQRWQVAEIKYLASKSVPDAKIADLFGISFKSVSHILNGHAWADVAAREDIPYLLSALKAAQEERAEQWREAREAVSRMQAVQAANESLRAELKAAQEERDEKAAFIEVLTRGKSPCGHWSAYAITQGAGQHITCLKCRADAAESALSALRAKVEEKRDETEDYIDSFEEGQYEAVCWVLSLLPENGEKP